MELYTKNQKQKGHTPWDAEIVAERGGDGDTSPMRSARSSRRWWTTSGGATARSGTGGCPRARGPRRSAATRRASGASSCAAGCAWARRTRSCTGATRRGSPPSKGRECDIDRRRDDRTFTSGVAALTQTLLRKSTLKATEGFYSIYAAIEVTKRQVPGFSVSESSVRNWIRAGRLANLTMAKVAIWRRSPSPKDKRTFPCRAKSKQGHHIADRPKEVDELKAYGHCEGDTIVSCSGDTTALYSLIERISDFQWTVKMSRNTEQCLHGALRRIVDSGAGIRTLTHDNGMESRRVKTIERILRAGGATGTCAFYADAYASNQRARNEKNHTFHRRFLGHGRLAKHSQRTVQKVNDFINDYPRRRFYGKSAREVRDILIAGGTPKIRPRPLKKWERAKASV